MDEFSISSGVFLAILTSTQQMGQEADQLLTALLQIQLSISALLKIYALMNMQTDIAERMLANRKEQERGRVVVEDTSAQKRSRKKNPKWMRNLGVAGGGGGDGGGGGGGGGGRGGGGGGGETSRAANELGKSSPKSPSEANDDRPQSARTPSPGGQGNEAARSSSGLLLPPDATIRFQADSLLIEMLSVGLVPSDDVSTAWWDERSLLAQRPVLLTVRFLHPLARRWSLRRCRKPSDGAAVSHAPTPRPRLLAPRSRAHLAHRLQVVASERRSSKQARRTGRWNWAHAASLSQLSRTRYRY